MAPASSHASRETPAAPKKEAAAASTTSSKKPAPATTTTTDEAKPRVGARDGGGATVRASTRTRGYAKKAPTGAGGRKFEWKDKTNDGTTYLAPSVITDPADPLYSSGNDDDENYVLVSGDAPVARPKGAADDHAPSSSSSKASKGGAVPPVPLASGVPPSPGSGDATAPTSTPKVSYCSGTGPKLVIGPRLTLAEFKRRVGECLEELFLSGDVDEAVRCVAECDCPEFAFEVVKRGVSKAMDGKARERELCSKFFAAAVVGGGVPTPSSGGGVLGEGLDAVDRAPRGALLAPRDVAKGFERLFEALDDLVLDAPRAPTIISDFLVRCVVDEVLPPAYLVDRVFAALGGPVVARARRMLSRDHAGAKLERIWGPGDGREARDLKVLVDQLLGEFAAADDVDEAVACVRELQAPSFGHEVVKRAVVFFLAASDDARRRCSALLKALATHDETSPVLTPTQARLGFERLRAALPDLRLDVPNAEALLDDFEARALADGVLLSALPHIAEGGTTAAPNGTTATVQATAS